MSFTVVDRPRGTSNVPDELVKALVQTEQSGKAVKVQLPEGTEFVTWQANVRARLRTDYNLRLRTKHNKANKTVIAWAEKFAEDRTADIVNSDENLGVENGDADAD